MSNTSNTQVDPKLDNTQLDPVAVKIGENAIDEFNKTKADVFRRLNLMVLDLTNDTRHMDGPHNREAQKALNDITVYEHRINAHVQYLVDAIARANVATVSTGDDQARAIGSTNNQLQTTLTPY
ncbi:MAG: hypothetical protein ACRCYR_11485 [Phycicoccus sp.]